MTVWLGMQVAHGKSTVKRVYWTKAKALEWQQQDANRRWLQEFEVE